MLLLLSNCLQVTTGAQGLWYLSVCTPAVLSRSSHPDPCSGHCMCQAALRLTQLAGRWIPKAVGWLPQQSLQSLEGPGTEYPAL